MTAVRGGGARPRLGFAPNAVYRSRTSDRINEVSPQGGQFHLASTPRHLPVIVERLRRLAGAGMGQPCPALDTEVESTG